MTFAYSRCMPSDSCFSVSQVTVNRSILTDCITDCRAKPTDGPRTWVAHLEAMAMRLECNLCS